MDEKYKIVEYDKYCSTCEHYNNGETDNIKDDICDECLEESGRVNSHKPKNYINNSNQRPRKKNNPFNREEG